MDDKQIETTKIDDGGAAFPTPDCSEWDGDLRTTGMSLRDYFAGQSLPVLLKQVECEPTIKITGSQDFEAIKQLSERIKSVASLVSMMAYAHADSMIAHRTGGESQKNPTEKTNTSHITQATFDPDPKEAICISVADCSVFACGDLVRPGSSTEIMIVRAVDLHAGTINVARGYGATEITTLFGGMALKTSGMPKGGAS